MPLSIPQTMPAQHAHHPASPPPPNLRTCAAGSTVLFLGTSTHRSELAGGEGAVATQLGATLGLTATLVMYDSARKG